MAVHVATSVAHGSTFVCHGVDFSVHGPAGVIHGPFRCDPRPQAAPVSPDLDAQVGNPLAKCLDERIGNPRTIRELAGNEHPLAVPKHELDGSGPISTPMEFHGGESGEEVLLDLSQAISLHTRFVLNLNEPLGVAGANVWGAFVGAALRLW